MKTALDALSVIAGLDEEEQFALERAMLEHFGPRTCESPQMIGGANPPAPICARHRFLEEQDANVSRLQCLITCGARAPTGVSKRCAACGWMTTTGLEKHERLKSGKRCLPIRSRVTVVPAAAPNPHLATFGPYGLARHASEPAGNKLKRTETTTHGSGGRASRQQ